MHSNDCCVSSSDTNPSFMEGFLKKHPRINMGVNVFLTVDQVNGVALNKKENNPSAVTAEQGRDKT